MHHIFAMLQPLFEKSKAEINKQDAYVPLEVIQIELNETEF